MSSNLVKLTVGGREYAGWTNISITRSIEAISGRFTLGLTERWPGQATVWPIRPGAECQVSIGGEPVITGQVDQIAPSFDAGSHTVSASGRDRTGRLVDCSAVYRQGDLPNIRLESLARKLASPFGISVKTEADTGGPFGIHISPGETAFEVLDRAGRHCGVLPISDGVGGLVLTKVGQARCNTALVQGRNVKSASLQSDITERFSEYTVLSSQQSTDYLAPEQASAVKARATDAKIQTFRPLVVVAESAVDIASARKRAQWEATVRAARAVSVSVTAQGWRQGNGELWPVNALVNVDLPWLRISGQMLISELTYSLDESGGTQTQMTLRRKDAFLPKPSVPEEDDPLALL